MGGATRFRYAVFSQPRTGSTWLCAHLANLGAFGVPSEYLNEHRIVPNVTRMFGSADACGPKGAFRLVQYIEAIEREHTTPNGCFGTKIQPNQLMVLTKGNRDAAAAFLRRFDALIVLSRRDRLGQAVSAAIAETTGLWRNDGSEPDISSVPMDKLLRMTGIYLGRHLAADGVMRRLCRAAGRPRLELVYEDMIADPDRTLQAVVQFLGQPDAIGSARDEQVVAVPERPPGRVAAAVRARFIEFIEGRDVRSREPTP